MANTHNLFLEFGSKLNLEDSKVDKLMKSRDVLKDRITMHFKDHHPDYDPKYFIQGSYKMGNTIQTKDNLCDLDLGVHFERESDVTGITLQQWVMDAVTGVTYLQEHMNKCIRVDYKDDYHIDLPVYAQDKIPLPILAVKNKEFEKSDPRGFTDWYRDNKTDQSHRRSKYLKAWGDNVRTDMLSGLAMTLLSIRNSAEADNRDDISLYKNLLIIKQELTSLWELLMPVRPGDNIISKHGDAFKRNFFIALDDFIRDAKEAIDTDSMSKASKLWRKHLGDRFPIVADKSAQDTGHLKSVSAGGERAWNK